MKENAIKEIDVQKTDVKKTNVKDNSLEHNATAIKTNKAYLGKWLILVWLNAIVGLFFGNMVSTEVGFIFGMVVGVSVFALPYAYLAKYADSNNNQALSKSLYTSVIVKMICQLFVVPDMYAGALALLITDEIFSTSVSTMDSIVDTFLYAFIATVLTGVFLSVLVMILTGIIYLFTKKNKET